MRTAHIRNLGGPGTLRDVTVCQTQVRIGPKAIRTGKWISDRGNEFYAGDQFGPTHRKWYCRNGYQTGAIRKSLKLSLRPATTKEFELLLEQRHKAPKLAGGTV
jgi:hypothetical protein